MDFFSVGELADILTQTGNSLLDTDKILVFRPGPNDSFSLDVVDFKNYLNVITTPNIDRLDKIELTPTKNESIVPFISRLQSLEVYFDVNVISDVTIIFDTKNGSGFNPSTFQIVFDGTTAVITGSYTSLANFMANEVVEGEFYEAKVTANYISTPSNDVSVIVRTT